MLDSMQLLRAMNGIRAEDVTQAQRITAGNAAYHPRRRTLSILAAVAALIALLSLTAYALGLFSLHVEELTPDEGVSNGWIIHDADGNELHFVGGDKLLTGLSFLFTGDELPEKVEFHPGWLPHDPKDPPWDPDGDGWVEYLIDDREQETDWYPAEGMFDAGIPYLIITDYALHDHVLVLNGECEIVKHETWGKYDVYEIANTKDIFEFPNGVERHLKSPENYVLMFCVDEGYMINVGGTLDLETLEHIARELEVRGTGVTVSKSYGEGWSETVNIARG